MRIMTVCLGNICRSPAAEAVLVHALAEAGLDHVEVTSAGTADYHVGKPPHELSVAEGVRRGYAFTTRAAQFDAEHFDRADLILAMDSANEADILGLARSAEDRAKVVRLGAFASDVADGLRDVPDPWGLPEAAYVAMYDQIEDAVDGLVRTLREDGLEDVLAEHRAPDA